MQLSRLPLPNPNMSVTGHVIEENAPVNIIIFPSRPTGFCYVTQQHDK